MSCRYCSSPVPAARADAGIDCCTSKVCVDKRILDRRSSYRLVMVPKQGFTIVERSDPNILSIGKSSGRTA